MPLGLTIIAKQEMGLDYHLGQELIVEDALGEGEPVPLLLPEPDLANYQLDHSLSQRLFLNISLTHWTLGLIHVLSLATQTLKTFLDNVSLELGGLPHVLPLAVHLEVREEPWTFCCL